MTGSKAGSRVCLPYPVYLMRSPGGLIAISMMNFMAVEPLIDFPSLNNLTNF